MLKRCATRAGKLFLPFLETGGLAWSLMIGVALPFPHAGQDQPDRPPGPGGPRGPGVLAGLERRSTAPLSPVEIELRAQLIDLVPAPRRGLGRLRAAWPPDRTAPASPRQEPR